MQAKAGVGGWGLGDGGPVRSYRELRVWQQAIGLVEEIYRVTASFPGEERFELRSQMRRATISVPSNIAEGHARQSTKEYLNHLSMAQGSLAELETQVEISRRLNYVSENAACALFENTVARTKQLHALRTSLEKRL